MKAPQSRPGASLRYAPGSPPAQPHRPRMDQPRPVAYAPVRVCSMRGSTPRAALHGIWKQALPAATLLLTGGFAVAAEPDWRMVEAYIDLDEAWHAKDREIMAADVSKDEKDRQRVEERGAHPDIVLAAAAARAIIETDARRAVEAAEFLVEHTAGLSPTATTDVEIGMAALVERIGPDWSAVDGYLDQGKGMLARLFSKKSTAPRALAAATAIVALGGTHDKTVEAAEFLIERGGVIRGGGTGQVLSGLGTLAQVDDYDNWPQMLMYLDRTRANAEEIDDFLARMSAEGNDPVVRATARYYAASRLTRSINTASTEERDDYRERALDLTTGLSAGVEDEEFVAKVSDADGKPSTLTLAEVEKDLLATIRYATVGGTVSGLQGLTLDGAEESLGDFSEQVVLVDFWATWCGPCIAALPKLRDLADELPAERFEILSISIDKELNSVTEFQADEPMPWSQWHVGVGSELTRTWQIRSIPTYALINAGGRMLAKGNALDDDFLRRLREAVGDPAEEDISKDAEQPPVEA